MYKFISTGPGIRYIHKGGGTAASVFCCLCIYLTLPNGNKYDDLLSAGITIILIAAGVLASYKAEPLRGKGNCRVTIDETAGMRTSVPFLPVNISCLIAGAILFRIFDTGKPFIHEKD